MGASLIERLASGDVATAVTATPRLSRELQRQFERHQRALGKHAWEQADALPYAAWLTRLWRHFSVGLFDSGAGPTLLNELQLAALWEGIIGADIKRDAGDAAPLWSTTATAKTAVDAWRLLNNWNIELGDCAQSSHEDHRRWRGWARQFQKRCAAQHWVDSHSLANRLIAVLGDAHFDALTQSFGKIVLVGFDSILPQQQSLLDALAGIGVDIEVHSPDDATGPAPRLREYENESNQWLDAARWARAKLLDDPDANIAIVAPNLGKAATAIDYALKQILSPRQLLAPGLSAALPYHLSSGKNLIDYPVANAALLALTPMAAAVLPSETIGRLLGSPFIHGADAEAAARSQLELWRRQLPYQISFRRLLKDLPKPDSKRAAPHCPRLIDALTAALPLLPTDQSPQPASHWTQRFTEWLERLGWPGERALDSDEFQAAHAFREALRNLASLDLASAPMTAAAALSQLRRRVSGQPFQPEAGAAPVQVLGVLEAAGQRFDALWFGGLVETDWPPTMRLNPFISVAVQRRAGVTEASLELNRERAAAQQQRLLAAADEVVLSRPRLEDDIPAEPSPLLAALTTNLATNLTDDLVNNQPDENSSGARFPTPAAVVHAAKPTLETFTDRRGPRLAPGPAAGGAALIEHQAKCPFRAFATHRLGAREIEENEPGLAATERGGLIHRALQSVWERIQRSQTLGALSRDERRAIILDAAEQAARRYHFSSGCGKVFQRTLTQWAVDTLGEWLEAERHRAHPFTAGALEEKTTLDLGGLELNLKVDRIDKMADGKLALIDYKTGVSDKAKNWGGARPSAPQLPLYACAQTAPVSVVAFGRVKKGMCGFVGVAEDDGFDAVNSDARSPNRVVALEDSSLKNEFADWDDLLAHWRVALPRLAAEFLDGEARVDPSDPSVCTYCALPSFCRVGDADALEDKAGDGLEDKAGDAS